VGEDVWYESDKVWYVHKEGFTLATELKPDVGTPELPVGQVRVRVESNGTIIDTDQEHVHRTNPLKLDYAEDLSQLLSLNECSVLHVLHQRYSSQLAHTKAGGQLIITNPARPVTGYSAKVTGKKENMPPHVFGMAQRAYWNMLMHRKDQTIVPLGQSGAGKTTSCQFPLTAGKQRRVCVCVCVWNKETCLRFCPAWESNPGPLACGASVLPTALQDCFVFQTMLLERVRVAQRPEGEGTFDIFSQMLAGLDLSLRTELHLHQLAQTHMFGILPATKVEEKQRASLGFSRVQAALETLGVTADEQRAIWHVLASIYHLGAAGVCKVGRKQFMMFEWAQKAASNLGYELEELSTAVFKHHLKALIQQVTAGATRLRAEEMEETGTGLRLTGSECVEGMAAGLYEELFAAIVSLINRSVSSTQVSLTSIMVVDTPGFHNPRHQNTERAATFEELCHNYVHERLQLLFHERTFGSELERYKEEKIVVSFDPPETSPASTVSVIDQTSSQVRHPPGQAEEPRGLLWILDEEVLVQGSTDDRVLDRLCSYFESKGLDGEEKQCLRRCEQPLQLVIGHRLGAEPVRYDLTGWIHKAKRNPSVQNASQILQESKLEIVKKLFLCRSKVPLICHSVAGMEGASQQASHRVACVRKTFSTSFAALRLKSTCGLIKLQLDALMNVIKRSEMHFIHCLVPSLTGDGSGDRKSPCAPRASDGERPPASFEVPVLRTQLRGSQLLDALRLYRLGFPDHMSFSEFRRRFQVLSPEIVKKYSSVFVPIEERKVSENTRVCWSWWEPRCALSHLQVFLKAGVLSRLDRQRDRLVSGRVTLLQAIGHGYLGRQRFKAMKIQGLALRCIQKNLRRYTAVRPWAWWQLLACVRPMLSINMADEKLRVKEEEVIALHKRLKKSEGERNEIRWNTDLLEGKITDLTAELSDERFKGEVACRALESERAERLRLVRELKEMQTKHEQVGKSLNSVEKQLEESQQQIAMREIPSGPEWQVRYDCTLTEIEFLRKRIHEFEERISSEMALRKEVEQKLGDLQGGYENTKRSAQQLKRKCKCLTSDLEDARVLMDSQQSRNHELEKKQRKFDGELAQALGEAAFERTLRERLSQENQALRTELYRSQQRMQVRCGGGGVQPSADPKLKAFTHLRFEIELERMKQIHLKELEDKEEELEDVRKSCQRRLRQLQMQLEQEFEERQMVLHEKQDLESLVGTLCEQIGHRDFDVEKRLRRDLRRTHALLADAQLLLGTMDDPGQTASKEEVKTLQLQVSYHNDNKTMVVLQLEKVHIQLENVQKDKETVDQQLLQLEHEQTDLLKRIEEDQEDLNELMKKHKDLIAQSSNDIAQIRDFQERLHEAAKDKQQFQEKLQIAQSRIEYMEHSMVERGIVSRQEAIICDLENKMEFQRGQLKRFETLVLRLRDSVMKMGEELEEAAEAEAREKEISGHWKLRMEEMKVEMDDLAERELEASRRRLELEAQVECLVTVKETLQADLETSIKRIADFQAVLEEESSDDSDTETERTLLEKRGKFLSLSLSLSLSLAQCPDSKQHAESRPGSALSLSLRSRELAKGGVQGSKDSSSAWSRTSPPREDKSPSSSYALSEFLEELRRKRVAESEPGGIRRDEGSLRPIYQTVGLSSLGKRLAGKDTDENSLVGLETRSLSEGGGQLKAGLVRSASLRSLPISSEVGEPTGTMRRNRFGSLETLAEPSRSSSGLGLAPSLPTRDIRGSVSTRMNPPRRWLDNPLEEDIDEVLSQPIVIRSQRFSDLPGEEGSAEKTPWKVPSLSYERRKESDVDILPAIRRPLGREGAGRGGCPEGPGGQGPPRSRPSTLGRDGGTRVLRQRLRLLFVFGLHHVVQERGQHQEPAGQEPRLPAPGNGEEPGGGRLRLAAH
uniref:Myosin XVIIIB n=1 Tax=Callorhinchus milii TaxID=7868 RepID=A0A4W3J6Y9_CALMI